MTPKPLVSLTSQLEALRARIRNQRFSLLSRFHAITSELSGFKRIALFDLLDAKAAGITHKSARSL